MAAKQAQNPLPLPSGDGEELLRQISGLALADESAVLEVLAKAAEPFDAMQPRIQQRAKTLVTTMREAGSGSGVEAFLYEYGLSNKEGVAVMCLAEALLRIPDSDTADRLIRDKFKGAEWDRHLGKSDSLFVNASSWGLLLTGKVVNIGAEARENPSSILKNLVGKCGEPVIRESLRRAMHIIGTQFVMGQDIADAKSNAAKQEKRGYRMSYDILGEGARNQQQADAYYHAYLEALDVVGEGAKPEASIHDMRGLSVKLSGLHPRYHLVKEERLMAELMPRLKELVRKARDYHLTLSVDAEEANRLDINLKIFTALYRDPEFADYDGLGYVLQGYQKRAYFVLDYLAALARETGKRMPLRLVKGAYWDSEVKYAQVNGLAGYPVFSRKEYTDVSYLACARKIFDHYDQFVPQFATHNAHTVASIMEMAAGRAFEFQRLHGMGEKLYSQLVDEIPVRIYAPVGRHEDLLAYLIRRLLENGANTSFVNLLMNRDKPVEEILANPLDLARAHGWQPNPRIRLPQELYPDRRNSQGLELGYLAQKEAIESQLAAFNPAPWKAKPMIVGKAAAGKTRDLPKPAALTEKAGSVEEGTAQYADAAMRSAAAGHGAWNARPVAERAAILNAIADAFEANAAEFYALCLQEAGKNLPDAIAEVREAADFCRYYAIRAEELMGKEQVFSGPTGERNSMQLSGRGVFVCISPWNFPLAIFTGQVVAALVTGNCVVAKPADQTPLIAALATRLMHEAGVPVDVLQLIPGTGKEVGEALVGHPLTAGVVFTGSTATARRINRVLAEKDGPIVPLIAETGGQNCMIIDSSAQPEQAVDDVIISAFGSSGQRCSALRVLFLQEDIAESFLALLAGAMREYAVGNPADLANDFGPVIDGAALQRLKDHVRYLEENGARLVASQPAQGNGHYFPPHAYEIPSIDLLKQEVFGPVLHIVRYKASELDSVIAAINSTGYGLTFGMESRIEQSIEDVRSRVHAGNIYINRSMIGATVGVQPFGGEGLSGTGPKAGGPYYLLRFVHERTVSVNTAAIGGNLELLL